MKKLTFALPRNALRVSRRKQRRERSDRAVSVGSARLVGRLFILRRILTSSMLLPEKLDGLADLYKVVPLCNSAELITIRCENRAPCGEPSLLDQ